MPRTVAGTPTMRVRSWARCSRDGSLHGQMPFLRAELRVSGPMLDGVEEDRRDQVSDVRERNDDDQVGDRDCKEHYHGRDCERERQEDADDADPREDGRRKTGHEEGPHDEGNRRDPECAGGEISEARRGQPVDPAREGLGQSGVAREVEREAVEADERQDERHLLARRCIGEEPEEPDVEREEEQVDHDDPVQRHGARLAG